MSPSLVALLFIGSFSALALSLAILLALHLMDSAKSREVERRAANSRAVVELLRKPTNE